MPAQVDHALSPGAGRNVVRRVALWPSGRALIHRSRLLAGRESPRTLALPIMVSVRARVLRALRDLDHAGDDSRQGPASRGAATQCSGSRRVRHPSPQSASGIPGGGRRDWPDRRLDACRVWRNPVSFRQSADTYIDREHLEGPSHALRLPFADSRSKSAHSHLSVQCLTSAQGPHLQVRFSSAPCRSDPLQHVHARSSPPA